MTENGHCSYLPDKHWILNDTYPDRQRLQHPYLYNVETGRRYPLGHFRSAPQYTGEWRCDTHPRFSPDGRCLNVPRSDVDVAGKSARRWAKWYVGPAVGLSMLLNALASASHAAEGFDVLSYGVGAVVPVLVFILGASHLQGATGGRHGRQ